MLIRARLPRYALLLVLAVAAAWAAEQFLAYDGIPGNIDPGVRAQIARLRSPFAVIRADAALELGRMGRRAGPAAPYLVERLDDPGWAEGWFAGFMARLNMHNAAQSVGSRSVNALIAIGPPAVQPLLDGGLHSEREMIRFFSTGILGTLADPAAIPTLKERYSRDSSFNVRDAALRSLAELRNPETLQLLLRQLASGTLAERMGATVYLGESGSDAGIDALIAALENDADPAVRQSAGASLCRITHQFLGMNASAEMWRTWRRANRNR